MGKPPEKRSTPTSQSEVTDGDPLAAELAKRLSSLLPGRERAQVIAQVTSLVLEERFSGPLPHPRHLQQYDDILPGLGRELVDMAHNSLAHSQELQAEAMRADIADMKEARRLGFAALLVLIIGAIICGAMGKDTIALALLGAGVIGTIGQVIRGRGRNSE